MNKQADIDVLANDYRSDALKVDSFVRRNIAHDIIQLQIHYARQLKILLKKENAFVKRRQGVTNQLLLSDELMRIKIRKDQVMSLCSNSISSRPWVMNGEGNQNLTFPIRKIGFLVNCDSFFTESFFIASSEETGILTRMYLEKIFSSHQRIFIQDIFCTLSLVLAFEELLQFKLAVTNAPQRIICMAKYKSLKKNDDVIHVFNLCGEAYRVSVVSSNFILEGVDVPFILC